MIFAASRITHTRSHRQAHFITNPLLPHRVVVVALQVVTFRCLGPLSWSSCGTVHYLTTFYRTTLYCQIGVQLLEDGPIFDILK